MGGELDHLEDATKSGSNDASPPPSERGKSTAIIATFGRPGAPASQPPSKSNGNASTDSVKKVISPMPV